MSLFFSLLPIYVFGNLHCMGMCGPLVLMLGRHRYRYYYFFGRGLSFTLAGGAAGGLGAVLHAVLKEFHVATLTSFLFGSAIIVYGILILFKINMIQRIPKNGLLHKIQVHLTTLMLRDRPLAVFLFGFFTLLLPCGQSIIVYSALALESNVWLGFFNGFIFALFTTPSLFLAMKAQALFKNLKFNSHLIFGYCALCVGGLAILRGCAEAGFIPHLVLNRWLPSEFHLVLY